MLWHGSLSPIITITIIKEHFISEHRHLHLHLQYQYQHEYEYEYEYEWHPRAE